MTDSGARGQEKEPIDCLPGSWNGRLVLGMYGTEYERGPIVMVGYK